MGPLRARNWSKFDVVHVVCRTGVGCVQHHEHVSLMPTHSP